ncbi:MAG: hypothetical protein QXG39_06460 [Candidatus Aenigmatarchaeota archaeon]
MEIRNFLIMLLLFSGIIVGVSVFISDLASKYNQNIQDLRTMSQITNIEQKSKELREAMQTKITGVPLIDVPFVAIKGFIDFIDLVATSLFVFWDATINSIASYLFLPTWFVSIITAIVIIIIMFEIISAIIKWRV